MWSDRNLRRGARTDGSGADTSGKYRKGTWRKESEDRRRRESAGRARSWSEIGTTLQEHPAVPAACAAEVSDEKVGERIKAFVVLKADMEGITGYDPMH